MRADKFFAERYGSRTKAQTVLARGLILKNGKPLAPDGEVNGTERFTFLESEQNYVSNGGYKLARGLETFGADVSGKVFADLGASTGGFTDCLLQNGAKRVYCVDVGKSQLDARIEKDPRVVVMDETNARFLRAEHFPEPLDGAVCDVSFISLKLILPAVANILSCKARAYVLFKPQFECEGRGLGKRGILPVSLHMPLLKDFYAFCVSARCAPQNIVNAPLRAKKNVEYVVELEIDGNPIPEWDFLRRAEKIF